MKPIRVATPDMEPDHERGHLRRGPVAVQPAALTPEMRVLKQVGAPRRAAHGIRETPP